MLRKPVVRNLVLILRLLLYCYMYSVICICHNPELQIKFCIFEYSKEATVYNVKVFKNRFRQDNSFSKTNAG